MLRARAGQLRGEHVPYNAFLLGFVVGNLHVESRDPLLDGHGFSFQPVPEIPSSPGHFLAALVLKIAEVRQALLYLLQLLHFFVASILETCLLRRRPVGVSGELGTLVAVGVDDPVDVDASRRCYRIEHLLQFLGASPSVGNVGREYMPNLGQ